MKCTMLRRTFVFCLPWLVPLLHGQERPGGGLLPGFHRLELPVEGKSREALVYAPPAARDKALPLVFVFHGHGGSMQNALRSFALHTHWPDAISVYPQGLPTPGRLTDPEGKRRGWQHGAGDQDDRDLKFFDALLARLKADHNVDEKRLFSTGHSNGGAFTYLLWAERGDRFAAVAPSAAVMRQINRLKPKPVMHLAGKKDTLVKFAWQDRMMQTLRKRNGCEGEGLTFGEHALLYPAPTGHPVVTFIHPGGHEFPASAPPLIVKFFKAATP
jgi:polyhydroxybutyrate depolymerase